MKINQYIRFFYAIMSGIIAGGLSGLLGITGSVIILPLLLFFGIFQNYKLAIGTVIFNKVLNEKILKYMTAFILFILSFYVFYNGYNTNVPAV
jgi:uncharacterized membrane protein YfcA